MLALRITRPRPQCSPTASHCHTKRYRSLMVFGLGNKGKTYDNTRHNIGFKVLDAFVSAHEGSWSKSMVADIASLNVAGQRIVCVKPSTMMNRSGSAYASLTQKHGVAPEDTIVLYDFIYSPFGDISIKPKKGHGGHNGMRSIIEIVGHEGVPSMRLGIGPQRGDLVKFVLSKWTPDEMRQFPSLLRLTSRALTTYAVEGPQAAMRSYNGSLEQMKRVHLGEE